MRCCSTFSISVAASFLSLSCLLLTYFSLTLFNHLIHFLLESPIPSVYYSLSTVSPGPPPRPHVRTVVHRGFVNEQRDKDSSSGVAPFDSNFGSNTCLLTTTDVRAGKAKELFETVKSKSDPSEGAETEIAWWIESAQLQVRSKLSTSTNRGS